MEELQPYLLPSEVFPFPSGSLLGFKQYIRPRELSVAGQTKKKNLWNFCELSVEPIEFSLFPLDVMYYMKK